MQIVAGNACEECPEFNLCDAEWQADAYAVFYQHKTLTESLLRVARAD